MVADGIRIRQEWMLQIVGPTIRAEWEIQLDDDVSSSIQHKHPVIMFQSLTHSLIILIIQSFIHSTFCFLQIFILRSLFELNASRYSRFNYLLVHPLLCSETCYVWLRLGCPPHFHKAIYPLYASPPNSNKREGIWWNAIFGMRKVSQSA